MSEMRPEESDGALQDTRGEAGPDLEAWILRILHNVGTTHRGTIMEGGID